MDFSFGKIAFATLYINPEKIPITEDQELKPINPYGHSKWITEKALEREVEKGDFNFVSLRYFNAAGAYFDGSIGEDHKTETHLIPLILQVPLGKRSHISIFGNDYDTKDGTCIRDYIHVMDLAYAHYKALEYLRKGNNSEIFNLGNGNGYSVKEVIDVARCVTDFDIPAVEEPRRSGDPAGEQCRYGCDPSGVDEPGGCVFKSGPCI